MISSSEPEPERYNHDTFSGWRFSLVFDLRVPAYAEGPARIAVAANFKATLEVSLTP